MHDELQRLDVQQEEAPFLADLSRRSYTFTSLQKATVWGIMCTLGGLLLVIHEVVGHGVLGCLAFRFWWEELAALEIRCSSETRQLGWVALAGTVIDLIVGLFALAIFKIYRLRVDRARWGTTYYCLWCYSMLSITHGLGALVSSLMPWGDLKVALEHIRMPLQLILRISLTVGGIGFLIPISLLGMRTLQPLLGREQSFRRQRAVWLLALPCVFGILLPQTLSGLIVSPMQVLVAFGSAMGGSAFLLIFTLSTFVRRNAVPQWVPDPPVPVTASIVWVTLGVLTVIAYFALSFGIPFHLSEYWETWQLHTTSP